MKDIAIVILNWNGEQMMRRFLPSVLRHSAEARVIVADNGSDDGSLQMLRSEFPTVEIIELHQNYGFAEGYNRALQQVEARYYLLLNSDVEVTPNWLQPLLSYMEAHHDVAACQPKLLAEYDRTLLEYAGAAGGYIDYLGYPYCRGRIFNTVERDSGQYDTVADVFWATGAALMVRADTYWAVGALDARFFAHQEEIDLCWRMRARGHRIVCVPASVVYHVGGGTLPKENPRKTFLNFRNNLYLLYKNLPDGQLRPVLRRRRWLDALAALMFLLKGQWRSFRAVLRARSTFRSQHHIFDADRAANLAAAQASSSRGTIKEIYPRSLLVEYYLRRHRRFSQL